MIEVGKTYRTKMAEFVLFKVTDVNRPGWKDTVFGIYLMSEIECECPLNIERLIPNQVSDFDVLEFFMYKRIQQLKLTMWRQMEYLTDKYKL